MGAFKRKDLKNGLYNKRIWKKKRRIKHLAIQTLLKHRGSRQGGEDVPHVLRVSAITGRPHSYFYTSLLIQTGSFVVCLREC